ncbi:MAG: RNA polymerase sigma factor [Saprospiraceae bacterium]|nr:RNA polymerase sigma factor [Saprospiraceae bacterium]
MYGVCKRYISSKEDAEDVLVESFFKVLTKIEQYQGNGNFEGWIRRIVVNEALMFIRKRVLLTEDAELELLNIPENSASIVEELNAAAILNVLDKLPIGYRTVFNLYVLEGYKHREIAEELGISINTSKSQLILAKKKITELLTAQD